MMYVRERMRVVQIWVVGAVIFLTALTFIATTAVKSDVFGTWLAGRLPFFSPFRWFWPWLPQVARDSFLLSVPFILAICLMIIGGFFITSAFNHYSVIKEAERKSRIAGLVDRRGGPRIRQSVGPINAGGDVNLQQIAEADSKLHEWDNSFWKGPLGAIAIAVIAIIVAQIFTSVTGLSH